jgi:hypothetical protein
VSTTVNPPASGDPEFEPSTRSRCFYVQRHPCGACPLVWLGLSQFDKCMHVGVSSGLPYGMAWTFPTVGGLVQSRGRCPCLYWHDSDVILACSQLAHMLVTGGHDLCPEAPPCSAASLRTHSALNRDKRNFRSSRCTPQTEREDHRRLRRCMRVHRRQQPSFRGEMSATRRALTLSRTALNCFKSSCRQHIHQHADHLASELRDAQADLDTFFGTVHAPPEQAPVGGSPYAHASHTNSFAGGDPPLQHCPEPQARSNYKSPAASHSPSSLTHVDDFGRATMVDVAEVRQATV